MPPLITPELVALDADLGSDKSTVVHRLAGLVAGAGRASSADGLADDALAREAQAATGLPGGIAIPHCRSAAVTEASLAFARLSPKVDFGAPDGPADLAFLIAAPAHGDADHLTLLTALARALVRPEFVASLRSASSDAEIVRLVDAVVSPAPAASPTGATAAPAAAAPAAQPAARKSIVVVSACPTGIAHTYMAADKLVAAGKAAGVDIHVETQGSSGATPLDPAVIRAADAAIFAALVWWYSGAGDNRMLVLLALLCLVLGVLTSYIKARAEGMGLACDVGVVERTERLILVLVGTGFTGLGIPYAVHVALWVLLAGSAVTVGQRVLAVKRAAAGARLEP